LEACAPSSNQDACIAVSEPVVAAGPSAPQADTDTEPTLDELIEAYIAFDVLWQHEQNMHVKFVTDCIATANAKSLASMRTRSKRHKANTSTTQQTDIDNAAGLSLNPDTDSNSALATEDRRIIPSEFQKLQTLLGVTFTLDACANVDGSNALCPHYCSPDTPFLRTDLANETVWLNPPFTHSLSSYLDHFYEQKQAHPELSGAILVPAWRQIQQHPLFAQYSRLVKTYPKGYHLFDSSNRATNNARQRLPGTPWPLQLWYCPPTAHAPLQELEQHAKLPLAYKCLVNKAKATTLFDTGAKGKAFLSKRFVDLFGIVPHRGKHVSETVELADGTQVETFGSASVTLHLQGLRVKHLDCIVCDLTPHFDLILGSDWLVDYKAILEPATATCTLFPKNGEKIVLKGQPSPRTSLPSDHPAETPVITSLLLSRMQVKRILRKQPDTKAFIAFVTEAKSDTPTTASATPTPSHSENLQALLDEYKDVFSMEIPTWDPNAPRNVQVTIPTEPGAKPPNRPLYRYSPREHEAIEAYITELLSKNLIQPSTSPYGAPVLFVPKPDGSLRMCIDYRALNKITLRNQEPIPNIADLLDRLSGAKFFTSLDLVGGYYQLPIHPSDIHKTAVKTPLGLYEFKILPMGLTNSPAVFQRAMNEVFRGKINKYVLVYLDDILVFSKTAEEHEQHLRSVLQTLREHKYYIKPSKCEFFQTELKYLGHIISEAGIKPDPN
jgi:Reverse transcriptase (RNA-dependent DNA polymerase)/Retroviral aspartyl protease